MNTITFSNYEASTTGISSLCSGIGYNVEIKDEEEEWSIWAVATRGIHGMWSLTHIRIVGKEDKYPSLATLGVFLSGLYSSIDGIMNKLIPSHQNSNNGLKEDDLIVIINGRHKGEEGSIYSKSEKGNDYWIIEFEDGSIYDIKKQYCLLKNANNEQV